MRFVMQTEMIMILDNANYKEFLKKVEGNIIEEIKLGESFIEIELSNGKTMIAEVTNEKTSEHQEFNNLKLIVEWFVNIKKQV